MPKFSDVSRQIKDGDLLVFSGCSWVSRLIKWATGSDLSHSGLAVWVGCGGGRRLCVIEATDHSGVRVFPLAAAVKECGEEGAKVYWQPLVDVTLDGCEVARQAMLMWGDKYPPAKGLFLTGSGTYRWAYAALFGGGGHYPDHLHCAQMVAAAIERAGGQLGRAPCLCTPSYLSSLPMFGERVAIT